MEAKEAFACLILSKRRIKRKEENFAGRGPALYFCWPAFSAQLLFALFVVESGRAHHARRHRSSEPRVPASCLNKDSYLEGRLEAAVCSLCCWVRQSTPHVLSYLGLTVGEGARVWRRMVWMRNAQSSFLSSAAQLLSLLLSQAEHTTWGGNELR